MRAVLGVHNLTFTKLTYFIKTKLNTVLLGADYCKYEIVVTLDKSTALILKNTIKNNWLSRH